MAWTTATTRSSGFLVTAAVWNSEHVDNMNFLREVAYTEFTANVSVTASTAATAVTVVSSGAISYEAVPHLIEFYAYEVVTSSTSGDQVTISLWDGATDLGRLARVVTPAASALGVPLYVARRLTPTAASHTYIVKAWRTTANGSVIAAAGGVDTGLPGFIRIRRIPT